jgi:3-oxoacyl-(acyl-carrier-protein) synthase
MNLCIRAASYLGPEGFGNDLSGLRAWPPPLAGPLRRGGLDGLHWSLVSASDPARFARMDLMCRLGFMAAELLNADFDAMPGPLRDRLGVCVETFTGSLDTDIRFARKPRPSLFAYTLPSTVIGEVCIRFRLRGPVLCLVSPAPGAADALFEAAQWLRDGEAEMALCFSIEALNRETMDSISLPQILRPSGWHACALLLGPAGNSPRQIPFAPGALADVCRNLCSAPNRA